MLYPWLNEDDFYSQPGEVHILIKHFLVINPYKPCKYSGSSKGSHTAPSVNYIYILCSVFTSPITYTK